MHERTRRHLALTAFGLLCLLPTVLVIAWGAVRYWPDYVAAEAQALSAQLGVTVSLEGLRRPRPGVAVYEGFTLADPETGQALLRCRLLEAEWGRRRDGQGNPRAVLLLTAAQGEIHAEGRQRLWQLVRQPLCRERPGAEFDVRLMAADVTLKSAARADTLTDVQGRIDLLPNGSEAQVAFRLAGVQMSESARVRIVRNRQTTPPTSGFELDTGGGALPCDLLAVALPELEILGGQCRFRGYLWANQSPAPPAESPWDGEITGQLLDVDLGRVVSEHFPHKLSGRAEVTVRSARFRQGRLEQAAGTIRAGPGVVGRSLIEAAAEKLRMVKGAEPAASGDLLLYEELSLAFLLDSGGLRLEGRCGGGPGAILADRQQRLLGEALIQPQPVLSLVQALVPANEFQVPATRQTDWLIRHLPVPQIVPPRAVEDSLPHARLRVAGPSQPR